MEGSMTKWVRSLQFLIILGLVYVVAVGAQLHAQQTAPQSSPQQSGQQPQAQPPDQSGQQAPDASQGQQPQGQTFVGTVVKSGDRYMLQDADSGTTYDIDRQDLIKPHEGKKVRVLGVLDPNGKLIHVK
jgi:Protein of unknown function (DUF5818)